MGIFRNEFDPCRFIKYTVIDGAKIQKKAIIFVFMLKNIFIAEKIGLNIA